MRRGRTAGVGTPFPNGEDFLCAPTLVDAVRGADDGLDRLGGSALAGRYVLERILGRGGGGVVYEARDELTHESVAVKVMRVLTEADRTRVRREVATLRWLRLPGVVTYRDDGEEPGGFVWCAMDLVRGRPFPGVRRKLPWKELEPIAVAFLEALARLHWAGIVHRDLKPANVLVERVRGGPPRVTIIDLGLAAQPDPRFGPDPSAPPGFTPRYAAPEQLRGEPGDARSDVYSAGVMIREALRGRVQRRGTASAIAAAAGEKKASRPRTAAVLLDRLSTAVLPCAMPIRAESSVQLRPLFAGPDQILHIREDAAQELWLRTSGRPGAIARELKTWRQLGILHGAGRCGQPPFVVLREDIERLASMRMLRAARRGSVPGPAGAIAMALTTRDTARAAKAALKASRDMLARGRISGAALATELGLRAAAQIGGGVGSQLAVVSVEAAVASGSRQTAARLRSAVLRAGCAGAICTAALATMDAVIDALDGRAGSAMARIEAVLPNLPRSLDLAAWSVYIAAARRCGTAAETLAIRRAAKAAACRPELAEPLKSWQAWLAYRRGACDRAFSVHAKLTAASASPLRRIKCGLDAATAALDALRFETARSLAETAAAQAAAIRLPDQEARARVLVDAATARSDGRSAPTTDSAALAALGHQGLIATDALTRAVLDWRRGDVEAAVSRVEPLVRLAPLRPGDPQMALIVAFHAAMTGTPAAKRPGGGGFPPRVDAQVVALQSIAARRAAIPCLQVGPASPQYEVLTEIEITSARRGTSSPLAGPPSRSSESGRFVRRRPLCV